MTQASQCQAKSVGHTDNLEARERTHNDGRGGTFTAKRRPVRIVYSERFATLDQARDRERQLKRWSGAKKEALISQDTSELKRLSRRRVR
jgi:putative endonuclease